METTVRSTVGASEYPQKLAVCMKARLAPLKDVAHRGHLIGNVSKHQIVNAQVFEATQLAPKIVRDLARFFDHQCPAELLERGE